MTAKASVDVEVLLRWTYSDRMVDVLDRRENDRELSWLRGAGSNADFVERYAALGCHIDCVGSAADAPARTAPDAEAMLNCIAGPSGYLVAYSEPLRGDYVSPLFSAPLSGVSLSPDALR